MRTKFRRPVSGAARGRIARLAACLGAMWLVGLGSIASDLARAAENPVLEGNPLVEIAGGRFVFGSNEGEENEAPERRIDLPTFHITKYEITNHLYEAFVAATGHRPAFYHNHPLFGLPDHPAVGLSWDDANDFCRHHGMKLPTEEQWERAARGPESRAYPWGQEPPSVARANRGAGICCEADSRDGYAGTAPVGSFPEGQTPEGVMDMAGNAWELVDGWYGPYGSDPAAREKEFRVLRGGAFNSDDWRLRPTYRLAYDGDFRFSANGGFRCVHDSTTRDDTAARGESSIARGPTAPAGYLVTRLAHDLSQPSGAARDGDGLILTDLSTGNIVRRAADGTQTVLYSGLPTGLDVIGEPTGPYKVQTREGRIYVAQGWQDVDREEGPLDHAVLEIGPGGAPAVISRDFWNPFDLEWGGDAWFVADSAKNALARMTLEGELRVVFTFPRIERAGAELKRLSATEFEAEETYEVDPVPTGIAVREDRIYVALFGGFPFTAGGGGVVSLPVAGGESRARIEARELDAPTDVAFDEQGRLLVLEMGTFDLNQGFVPGTGRLLRIDLGTGVRTVLLDGLTRPVTVVPMDRGAVVVVQLSGDILEVVPAP